MKYDNSFTTIDSEEKAYFLGQAFGDGYNSGTAPYKFSMASIDTDIILYTKMHELFPFLKIKRYKTHPNIIYLENNEKKFIQDLSLLGLNSNKTKKDISGEFHFPNISKEYIHHFIRGYFDADGSVWFPSRHRSRNNTRMGFGCATKNFLLEINKVLKENDIHLTFIERSKKASNGKFYTSWELISSNRETSLKFADYIYKDASIFLQYKYDRFYKAKDLRPSAYTVYGKCPYCGSEKIKRSGYRNNKARLKCKDCNKGFTKTMPTQEVTLDE